MNHHKTFEQLVAALCSRPADLKVSVIEGKIPVITLTPHGEDYGALCGRMGWTIDSLNIIATAMSLNNGNKKTRVVLDDSGPGLRGKWKRLKVNAEWTSDELDMAARLVVAEIFDGEVKIEYIRASVSDVKMAMFANNPKWQIPILDWLIRINPLTKEIVRKQPTLEQSLAAVFGAIGGSQGMRVTFELEQLGETETRRI